MNSLIAKFSADTLRKIAEAHVTRFSDMLRSAAEGASFIRVNECEDYKRLWQEVAAGAEHKKFSQRAEDEILDALFSGGYDDMLTDAEREFLEGDDEEEVEDEETSP